MNKVANHSNYELLSAEEVKSEELKILIAFRDLCESKGLMYSLYAGTLLGAVRHRGFIPWDDDIDVCMPRPDYERLLSMDAAIIESLGLQRVGYFDMSASQSPFIKIVNPSVRVKASVEAGENSLWIDVFPVDGLPDDLEECVSLYKKVGRARRVLQAQYAAPEAGSTAIKRAVKRLARPVLSALRVGRWCAAEINSNARRIKYGDTYHVGGLAWGLYGPGERIPLAEFESQVEFEFENERFAAMSCWDEYLTGIYGDYMTPPPEERRVAHGLVAWREPPDE